MSRTEGGYDTARITASEQDRIHREQREADARRYLLDRGETEVAEILGLTPPTCLSCGQPMDGKGWFCQAALCRSPLVRRQSLAHAKRAQTYRTKES